MTPPITDPGHVLPDDEWARVQRDAQAIASAEKLASAPRAARPAFPSVTGFIQAKYDGGAQPGGRPTFGVLHDAETPLAAGYALAISNYFTRNTNETSAHFMLGPDGAFQLLDTSRIGWHCGNGNTRSIGVEQAGYAAFSRDQWLTADGVAQMARLARLMGEIEAVHGIGTFFMTDDQLRAAWRGDSVGGWATHDQCRRVLGGTSHTDPMPAYPFDELAAVLGDQPAPPPPPAPGAPPRLDYKRAMVDKLGRPLPSGHYIGAIEGPSESHGGDARFDSDPVRGLVQNVLEWFIYHGCVQGVPSSAWGSSPGWTNTGWNAAYTDPVCKRWHDRFYPNQRWPFRIYSDDYDRLARP